MTYLAVIDQATVHVLHARAKFFLWDQRYRRGNAGWFDAAHIAASFGKRPHPISLMVALNGLVSSGDIQSDSLGRVRHA